MKNENVREEEINNIKIDLYNCDIIKGICNKEFKNEEYYKNKVNKNLLFNIILIFFSLKQLTFIN
jgi:hypothetical protein